MSTRSRAGAYRPTESKYKGGVEEMYITYDLKQQTRGGNAALYPKVKRVYVSGDFRDWRVGTFTKKSGRTVRGVKIDYAQQRQGYRRRGYRATRDATTYTVSPTKIESSTSTFSQIVEVPSEARNVQFHSKKLPTKYRAALQNVR